MPSDLILCIWIPFSYYFLSLVHFTLGPIIYMSRYSEWIRAGRPRVGVRVPVGLIVFASPYSPYRLCGPPSLFTMGIGRSFPRDKVTGPWSWSFTSNWIQGQENVDLYIQSTIRLQGIVLTYAQGQLYIYLTYYLLFFFSCLVPLSVLACNWFFCCWINTRTSTKKQQMNFWKIPFYAVLAEAI
jgi:hypothetical protein